MKFPGINWYQKFITQCRALLHPEPARDWHILVVCAGLVLVASVVWNAVFFLETVADEAVTAEARKETTLDTSLLKEAKDAFEARAAERERYGREYGFIDPSR